MSRTALEEVLEFKAPIPQAVATLEDMEAARALLSELKVRKEVAVVRKYGRHIVSVEWNLHARSVLGGAPAAASASLERIKEVLPTCDGFFMDATHLRYGAKQVLERSKVMLAFATDDEAYAARQQLQMQKVKGEGNWEAVEFGRNVANLSRPKGSRPKGSLVFVCPLSGAEGAEWLSSKVGVPWDYVLEEPEFARNKTGGGFTVYTASYGSNWAKIALHKIVGDRPYREAEAPSCFQCGGVGHVIALQVTRHQVLSVRALHAGSQGGLKDSTRPPCLWYCLVSRPRCLYGGCQNSRQLGEVTRRDSYPCRGTLGADVPKCCRDCGAAVIGNLKSWLDGHRLACPPGRLPAWAKRKAERKQQRSKPQTAPPRPVQILARSVGSASSERGVSTVPQIAIRRADAAPSGKGRLEQKAVGEAGNRAAPAVQAGAESEVAPNPEVRLAKGHGEQPDGHSAAGENGDEERLPGVSEAMEDDGEVEPTQVASTIGHAQVELGK